VTRRRIEAVLFDRDGTLVRDVAYNGDPAAVRPMPGAAAALARLREHGLRLGVVTNQSGVARGYITAEQLDAVHRRIHELLGPFDTWRTCEHDETAGCPCRKPRPGMVLAAARDLGVDPGQCVVVGDIGSDIAAAQSAGAIGVLVPTSQIKAAEVAAAPVVVPDLAAAVDWILAGETTRPADGAQPFARKLRDGAQPFARKLRDGAQPFARKLRDGGRQLAPPDQRVLAVRADSVGDVLLTGPAIRALASRASRVTLLCGPRGRSAAELLPGIDEVMEWAVPWLDPSPPAVDAGDIEAFVKQVRDGEFDRAVVFTSFHQSPLPTALLLRLAGVAHISAISSDYPGSLLDVRLRPPGDVAETERALTLASAAGYPLPGGDDGRLRLRGPLPCVRALTGGDPYVVLHPGTSVPARACPPHRLAQVVTALHRGGWRVIVTGAPTEAALTHYVAGRHGIDLGGRTSLRELAAVLAGARCVVVGNTGPAHLAAAVGTAVVSLYAPTVPYGRWRPYGVAVVRLGEQEAACRDSRATLCPVLGHPCLSTIESADVLAAVEELSCAS
jgi:histidinol-phosphate phosphatase family protein